MKKEKEIVEAPKLKFIDHYRVMWPFVKPYLFRALFAIALCVPIGALDAVVALALKPYMDVVLVDKTDQSPVYIPLLIVGFTLVQGTLNYISTYMNSWVGGKISMDVKGALYRKLLWLSPSFYDRHDTGYIIQRFSADADASCAGLIDNVRLFTSRVFSSLSLIGVLIYNSWQLSIIAIGVLVFGLLPLAHVRRMIKGIIYKSVQKSSTILTNYTETCVGNKTVASYNLQEHEFQKYDKTMRTLFKLGIKMIQRTAWMTPMLHVVASIGIGAVIGYGSYLIVNGTITSGNFVSFLTALIMLYNPIKSIGKNFSAVQVSFLAIERIAEILSLESDVCNSPKAKALKKVEKSIEFSNVNFAYNPDCPVLKGINFKVRAGETIAVVGNSGGGKSTLVSLLPRFYDVTSGAIMIDGKDIRDFTLESLRNQIAVVFQDNFLFSGTIRDNIILGKADATDEEINKALEMAYLKEFVDEQEDGLDTDIGERGSLLSGGQRQRLAIARAFLKNAPIVILDEATSALDNKAEAVVQKAIDNLMQDRTVFVIAHRLSTIQNADEILVVNDGEIVERGNHDELLKLDDGAYKSLYNAQFKKKEAA